MSLPRLISIREIKHRLERIFPEGLEMRQNLVREMAARVVYVFTYGGMIEGSDSLLRPSHVYLFTEKQARLKLDIERDRWVAQSRKPKFRPSGKRWYADTTREPIRDETIRFGLLDIGAVGRIEGGAITSSKPVYFLRRHFANLFDPLLTGSELGLAIAGWQRAHLTRAARARMALLAAGKVKKFTDVMVACPDGTMTKLSPGPSSLISRDVVEIFAINFLKAPALLWLSESGAKVRYEDDETARALGLKIEKASVLPDIILVNVGKSGEDTALVFIEVVASDGPMNQNRKNALLSYVRESEFPEDQCWFGTAFEDRASVAFKKVLPQLAWGTFAWFRSEPDKLIWLAEEPYDITALLPV